MAYIAHVVIGVWCDKVGICDARACTVCVNRSGIISNQSAYAITDHSKSAKDIDPYFKSQLYVKDSGRRQSVFILLNGLSKPGEREHDRNVISSVGWIRTDNLLIDSPTCYHCAVIAICACKLVLL